MPRDLRKITPAVAARGRGVGRYKTACFDHGAPIAKIDTRPMVFVAFLLAVMMLVPASQVRTHALLIDLPQPSPTPFGWGWETSPPPYMLVEITEHGQAVLDGTPVPIEAIPKTIKSKQMEWPIVLFRPHPDAEYRASLLALDAILKAGVHRQDICFDRLADHRTFDKASFHPIVTIIDRQHDSGPSSLKAVTPSGCAQFNPPLPLY